MINKFVVSLIMIFILFISSSTAYTIDEDLVYFDDAYVYLSAYPHTINSSGWVYFNFTSKVYTGDVDFCLGYDNNLVTPMKHELYNPHWVNWTTNHQSYFHNVSSITQYNGDDFDFGNSYNTYQRQVIYDQCMNHSEFECIEYEQITANCSFNSYTQEGTNYTIYWHTNHSRYELYSPFPYDPSHISYNFQNMTDWYYIQNVPITQNHNYQMRIWIEIPVMLEEIHSKYFFAIKPSGETISQAIANGHFYYLDPWYNTGWNYRKEINITGESGAGTYYQVNLSIGNTFGGDFHLEGHCTDFPNDIQFTDDDETTAIPYWIENVSADPIKVWVNVSDDLNTSQDIYIYYGKTGASSASNGDNTFLAFEDFDGGADWSETDPNNHIVQDRATDKRLEWNGVSRGEDAYVYADKGVGYFDDFEVRYKASPTGEAGNGGNMATVAFANTVDDYKGWWTASDPFLLCRFFSGTYTSISAYEAAYENIDIHTTGSLSDLRYMKLSRENGNAKLSYYSDSSYSTLVASNTLTNSVTTSYRYIFLLTTYNDGNAARTLTGYSDTYFVRKYQATEPIFASAGSEEQSFGFTSGTLASDNTYMDILMSEGVYNTSGGSGALETTDFALTFTQNGGGATNTIINGVTKTTGGSLVGGETTIRANLTVTGTPSGVETIEIKAVVDSIYNAAGDVMADTVTTGEKTLNDQVAPTVSSFSPLDNAINVNITDNLVITFSEAVDAETGNITIKKTSDDSIFETISVIDAKVTGSGTTIITINPAGTFAYETGYYILIDATGFDDAAGESFGGISDKTTWNFTTSSQAPWLSGWDYRKIVTITGGSGAGSDYQVDLDIGASSGGDLNLEGHCTNFPQDIQVTDNDGTTTLDFWIADTAADPIKVGVEVADDLGSNVDIFVYYGKSGATTDSNGDNTFLFFDDFENGNLNKWDTSGGSRWSVDTNSPKTGVYSALCDVTQYEQAGRVLKKVLNSSNISYEYDFKVNQWIGTSCHKGYTLWYVNESTTEYWVPFYVDRRSGYHCICRNIDANNDYDRYPNNKDVVLNQWMHFRADTVFGTSTQHTYLDGFDLGDVDLVDWHNNPITSSDYFKILQIAGSGGWTTGHDYLWLDNFIVRKYNSPEPIFASAEAEESATTDTTFTVTLPVGHTYAKFEPALSTSTNVMPNGQTSSVPFFNVTNTGNIALDIRMKLNTTATNIDLKADTDNNPTGSTIITTSLQTIQSNLAVDAHSDIWLWSDFDHAIEQTTNKTLEINVTQ